MELREVESSAVTRVGYDEREQSLYVEFKPKRELYRYLTVPEERYGELLEAASIGGYVNQEIKPNYPYEKVEHEDRDAEYDELGRS